MSNNPIKYSDLISPDNSITDLIKQLQDLSATYSDTQRQIKQEAIQLTQAIKSVSGANEEGREATKKAASDADRLAKAQRDLAFAESNTAKEIAELKQAQREANAINKLTAKLNQSAENSYNRLSAQYSLNKLYINNMSQAERDAAEASEGLITKTRELYEAMKRMQEETGKHQLNVGNYPEVTQAMGAYTNKLTEAIGLNSQLGQSLLDLAKNGNATKEIFAAMGDGVKALGNTLRGLLTNPVFMAIAGIAGVGQTFKWWYDYNSGLVEATEITQQFTGKVGDDLKAFRNQIQSIADVFGKDFKDVLTAASAVAEQFGISANEALNMVQTGFAVGADTSGHFLDTLQKYPASFRELGISADQFVAIVSQVDKSAIFSDKGVDALKEANSRLREMKTKTSAALEGIGLSSEQIQKDLLSGSKTMFQVIQDISARLNELPDNSEAVGRAVANIFGGAGKDAGLQYLRELKDIELSLDDVKEKSGELAELHEKQMRSQLELQNALSALFDMTGGNFEALTTNVKTFVNGALAGLVKGVISIINYMIDLYNKSMIVRASFQGIATVFKTQFDIVGNILKSFVAQVKGVGRILKGVFTLDWDEFKQGLEDYAMAFPKMIKETAKDAKENFREGLENIEKEIKPITIPVSVGDGKPLMTQVTAGAPQGGNDNVAEKEAGKATDAVEKAYKKNLEATRKYEDAVLALEKDEWRKREQQTQYQYSRQIEDLKHQLNTDKELNDAGRKAITESIKALEQQQTDALLKIGKERQLQELQLQKDTIALRLKAVREGSEEERRLKLEQIELEKQIALLHNEQKPAGQRQAPEIISASFDKDIANIADTYKEQQLAIFDQQQALAQSEFDLLRSTEQQKTEYRLKAEKDRLQKILELNETAANKMSDVELQTIKNAITKIEQEIDLSKRHATDIYGIFGLELDDDTKGAINTSMQYAKDALDNFVNEYVAAVERKVSSADREVDAAQKVLEAEIASRNAGYANNVAMAQKELDMAKKNQAKALEEQKKAQKAEAAIQAISQAGDLITASAKIWGQLGFPYAIPALAVMWGSFALSKIKARQVAKETYGEGTVEMLVGGSHQSGNDIDLGTKPDGTRRRAEGGEFFAVINRRNSRKYRHIVPDIINSLNRGTFEDKYMNMFGGSEGVNVSVNSGSLDIRSIERDVRNIKKQNETKYYTMADGSVVIERKNIKRIIKT